MYVCVCVCVCVCVFVCECVCGGGGGGGGKGDCRYHFIFTFHEIFVAELRFDLATPGSAPLGNKIWIAKNLERGGLCGYSVGGSLLQAY